MYVLRPRYQASRRSSGISDPTFYGPIDLRRKDKDLGGIKREADEMDDEQFRPGTG
jgi:hypothetical protein